MYSIFPPMSSSSPFWESSELPSPSGMAFVHGMRFFTQAFSTHCLVFLPGLFESELSSRALAFSVFLIVLFPKLAEGIGSGRGLLRSITTKGNHLHSHNHKGEHPIGEKAYKILYPLSGRPTPTGCTGIDQSEERDPSNITLL